jgi:hypothetical protein
MVRWIIQTSYLLRGQTKVWLKNMYMGVPFQNTLTKRHDVLNARSKCSIPSKTMANEQSRM